MSESDEESSSGESSDSERIAIRDELKSLTFEELLKLKEEVGLKCYSNTVFKNSHGKESQGSHSKADRMKKEIFKRGNKNRPREESSKIPVKSFVKVSIRKDVQIRDPRFDSLCGEFNESAFTKNYEFVNDIRQKEIKKLQSMQRREKDQDEKSRIQGVMERMKNQERSRQMRDAVLKEKQTEKKKNVQLIREGKKPHFRRKVEKKAFSLIDKYEKLKSEGRLEKYMKKKNKEHSRKSSFKPPV